MTNPTWEELKTQAIVEALEVYIQDLKDINANPAAIELYTQIVKEIDPNSTYSVL
jgi:hypothetical protein